MYLIHLHMILGIPVCGNIFMHNILRSNIQLVKLLTNQNSYDKDATFFNNWW